MKKYVDRNFLKKFEQSYSKYNGQPYNVNNLFEKIEDKLLKERQMNILVLNEYLSNNSISIDPISIKDQLIVELKDLKKANIDDRYEIIFLEFLEIVGSFARSFYVDFEENKNKKDFLGNYKEQKLKELELICKIQKMISDVEIFEIKIEFKEILPQDLLDLFEYNDNKITIQGYTITCYEGTKKLADSLKEKHQINIKVTCNLLSGLLSSHGIITKDESIDFADNLIRNINRIDKEKIKTLQNFISTHYRN